ncbi:dolichyl-phosphate beta-D-mannosyltransferase [Croceivirga radicis]|uniref:Dolichyl-phosphate beta-D-mannosyltransferase n=1 Tax=Croceivirga radicis TaxID=1929488 RepID=A0A1V6LSE6_9FLAO|nr:polyprenol monophosphomannose synthase [Croceivirga radicis]OQD43092.1 dolichyl-phosphate beta-D-mannosyltransferase [Croceivirga radicis]
MKKTVLIIIPTYNEKDNINEILSKVFAEQNNLDEHLLHVLIVDDNSPDGTAAVVNSLMKVTYRDKLFILNRPGKLGLGTAYITGFKWALKANYDLIFEMDADLSHDPKYLPEFLKKSEKADLVLGTRYMPGGGVVNWGKHRILISKGGNIYSKLILGLPYRDLTGGYKCFSNKVLRTLDLDNIMSNGYAFQIELTYRTHLLGYSIKETPIVFHDRIAGKSKLSNTVFSEAVKNIILLRLQKKRLPKKKKVNTKFVTVS